MKRETRMPSRLSWAWCGLLIGCGTTVLAAEPTSPVPGATAIRIESGIWPSYFEAIISLLSDSAESMN